MYPCTNSILTTVAVQWVSISDMANLFVLFFNSLFLQYAFLITIPEFTNKNVGFNHSRLPIAKLLQSCPTLCDPIDRSPPGSPVPGILQARTLEWVAISFSNAGKWKVKVKLLSRIGLFSTPWTAAYQAPPSMGFSRQEYWSGVPLSSPHTILVVPKGMKY